ncbi:hypothetical protein CHELA40_50723 [Chelatococcus asaccharovorans]|nr:hypothetical protein CHELA17_20689 [Chelatococcus asaccharovorans]CAH1694029.1 hypothetical protein CHELA40_50723 [Chelatococcus asaccharovorans]
MHDLRMVHRIPYLGNGSLLQGYRANTDKTGPLCQQAPPFGKPPLTIFFASDARCIRVIHPSRT